MCAGAKTNCVSLVSPDLNTIELLFYELWRRIRDRSVQSSTASGCSPLTIGVDSQYVVRRHMLLVRNRYETVIAAGEGHVCFWTNLTQVN